MHVIKVLSHTHRRRDWCRNCSWSHRPQHQNQHQVQAEHAINKTMSTFTNEWVCVLDWPSSAPPLPWFHTDHWVLTSLTASLLPHTFKQTEHSMQIQCSAGLMTSHFTLELISSTHGTCDITLYHRPQICDGYHRSIIVNTMSHMAHAVSIPRHKRRSTSPSSRWNNSPPLPRALCTNSRQPLLHFVHRGQFGCPAPRTWPLL